MKNIILAGSSEKTLKLLSDTISGVFSDADVETASGRVSLMVAVNDDTDLIVVNTPLTDEQGLDAAQGFAAETAAQVIVITDGKSYTRIRDIFSRDGIILMKRPLEKREFLRAVSDALVIGARVKKLTGENARLRASLEEVRLVNRAKAVLMRNLGMKEDQAHRYIEKQAMDLRTSRLSVAQSILKTYYNK